MAATALQTEVADPLWRLAGGKIVSPSRRRPRTRPWCIMTRHVVVGVPYETILETAEAEKVDLIVMATHGHTGLSHLVLGSVLCAWHPVPSSPFVRPPRRRRGLTRSNDLRIAIWEG